MSFDNCNKFIDLVCVFRKWPYVLVAEPVDPLIFDRKIDIYPFPFVQRGVAGQV